MTPPIRPRTDGHNDEAVVWIDHDHALIVELGAGRARRAGRMDRAPRETEASFNARAADDVADDDRVVVSGPSYARTGFERAYVALTHRPDRLVDVG
jgi:hypothetical protein